MCIGHIHVWFQRYCCFCCFAYAYSFISRFDLMLRFHSWSTIEKYSSQAKPSKIEIRKIIVGHVQVHGTQNKRHYLTTTVRNLCFIRFEYSLCNGNKRELNMIIENLHFVCVFFLFLSTLFLFFRLLIPER